MASLPIVVFDRVVSKPLESALGHGGLLHGLVERSVTSNGLFDLQLRANPKSNANCASVYIGLTTVLNVEEVGGAFRIRAHATHQKADTFDPIWTEAMSSQKLAAQVPAIDAYLDEMCTTGTVAAAFTDNEGRVQGSLCTGSSQPSFGFQREAAMSFRSAQVKSALIEPFRARVLAAAKQGAPAPAPNWWPGVRNHGAVPRLGLEIDVMGVDDDRRLLVIEVKPPNALEGIAWAPAQVRLYAESVALWLEVDPDARDRVLKMCEQRARIGLPAPTATLPTQSAVRVVPVVAIGEGPRSPRAIERLQAVYEALATIPSHSSRLDAMEVWIVAEDGSITSLDRPWSEQ